MTIPDTIAPEEELGRDIYSRRHARRAQRKRVPLNVFLVEEGNTKISVDRLTFAPPDKATANAEKRAIARNATFYGWAVVTAEKAGDRGRHVIATPKPEYDNPYHADIVLPELAGEDRDEQKDHAQKLADASQWRERPDIQFGNIDKG